MFYVYFLYSSSYGQKYIGMTENVSKRLKEHNAGKTKSTKAFVPWKVLYCEEYPTRIEARKREKFLKSGVGREFLKNKLDLDLL